jgi:hypothetical protein
MATVRRPMGHIWPAWALQRQSSHDMYRPADGLVVVASLFFMMRLFPSRARTIRNRRAPSDGQVCRPPWTRGV